MAFLYLNAVLRVSVIMITTNLVIIIYNTNTFCENEALFRNYALTLLKKIKINLKFQISYILTLKCL